MAKKKKTRQQKILADKRREVLATALYSFSPESPKQREKQSVAAPVRQTVTIASSSYGYLAGDLSKTAIFTGIVVLIELVANYFL